MDYSDHFDLTYEEWELKWNSLPPTYIFQSVLENIISSPFKFKGWIYECNRRDSFLWNFARLFVSNKYRQVLSNERYVLVKSFNNNEREEYVKAFIDCIYVGNTMCIIKTGDICNLKQSLSGCFLDDSNSGYHMVSNGTIKNNLKSKVFVAPVEMSDWSHIESGETLLVVWGEGTAVFTLEKQKE